MEGEGLAKGTGLPRLSWSLDILQAVWMSVQKRLPDCGDVQSWCVGQLQTSLVPAWVS